MQNDDKQIMQLRKCSTGPLRTICYKTITHHPTLWTSSWKVFWSRRSLVGLLDVKPQCEPQARPQNKMQIVFLLRFSVPPLPDNVNMESNVGSLVPTVAIMISIANWVAETFLVWRKKCRITLAYSCYYDLNSQLSSKNFSRMKKLIFAQSPRSL